MAANRKPQYAVIDEYSSSGTGHFKGWRAYYKAEPAQPFHRILLLAKGFPSKGNFTEEQAIEFVYNFNRTGTLEYNIFLPHYLKKTITRSLMYSKVNSTGYHFTAAYLTEEKFNKIFENLIVHLI